MTQVGPKPQFNMGDTVFSIWRAKEPIVFKYSGQKYVIYFPGKIVQSKIMTSGAYDSAQGVWTYKSMGNLHQPATVYEDGLYKTRHLAEKSAREIIVDQVCAVLKLFFEIATKAGYGSKTAWREIMDAAFVKMYSDTEQ